ncbi:hypothetical protein W97_05148 [Coniosporium apollinis CBS 100218]|uniref:Uncharacterized protein n=1 Tax=Coniosporium apollinis (strain CBS 100218) TaxID=1168221 RepID=R7YW47_CONA1|nr:uncharacterized protein W97_05148 [Coniosporium apollinis CBS 100218]EON65906.1 hypothetical protein W97_05148 [Coniosporium apollinis CBS 100218]
MRFSHDTSISTSSLLSLSSSSSRSSAYIKHGIGGAGNFHRASEFPPTGPPAPYKRHSGSFTSGIGGFGNIHHASERALLSFDEELARGRVVQRKRGRNVRFGIGGAGNFVGNARLCSRSSEQSFKDGSAYSSEPLPYGAFDALRRKWSRAWSRWGSLEDLERE